MPFTIIPRHDWPRNEIFTYYLTQVPCQYSMTVSMDITGLMLRKRKLYPSMLYALATVINRHEEFRMAFSEDGTLGFYDRLHPCYTVFHRETETFSRSGRNITPIMKPFFRPSATTANSSRM